MTAADDGLPVPFGGVAGTQPDDLTARHHQLLGAGVGEPEDGFYHLPFLLDEDARCRSLPNQDANFVLGHGGLLGRTNAQQS